MSSSDSSTLASITGQITLEWDQWLGSPDIMFIELGINDLANEHCPFVPEEVWQEHYGAMLDRIQQDAPGVQIVVGTIPWCGWQPDSNVYRKVLRYNTWITIEANKRGIPVADLWSATVGLDDGLSRPSQPSIFPPFHGDNFQPNDVGHRRLATTFFDAYLSTFHSTFLPIISN